MIHTLASRLSSGTLLFAAWLDSGVGIHRSKKTHGLFESIVVSKS